MTNVPFGEPVVKPDGYDSELVEELTFTHSEIDMLYFVALAHVGHPEARHLELTDDGLQTLIKALARITAWEEKNQAHTSEPEVAEVQ